METRPEGAPILRRPTSDDFRRSLSLAWRDFVSAPLTDLFFASFFVFAGLLIGWITYVTGQTFWLVLAVLGFSFVGTFGGPGVFLINR